MRLIRRYWQSKFCRLSTIIYLYIIKPFIVEIVIIININRQLMKSKIYIALLMMAAPLALFADDYIDDIYFNPKKDKIETKKPAKKTSYYIDNMADVDVDAYNRRGEVYYLTSIDTIGASVETGEDFVNVQKIQKFYNPTIILDNADLLAEVLNNSVGNVEVNYYGDIPYFSYNPFYSWYPSYYSYYWSPQWNWGWNWGWGSVLFDPWYNWGWGPSWAWNWGWGLSWGTGWGPSWSWSGPSWGWTGNYNSGGNHRVGASSSWSQSTLAGSSGVSHRPNSSVGSYRVGTTGSVSNAGTSTGYSYNNHRTPAGSSSSYSTNRYNNTTNRYNGTTTGGSSNRYQGSTSSGNRNVNSSGHRSNSTQNSYRNSSSSSHSSGSFGGSRSSGSFGGGRSGGGGGRHR